VHISNTETWGVPAAGHKSRRGSSRLPAVHVGIWVMATSGITQKLGRVSPSPAMRVTRRWCSRWQYIKNPRQGYVGECASIPEIRYLALVLGESINFQ
jgi:hypothetical protein